MSFAKEEKESVTFASNVSKTKVLQLPVIAFDVEKPVETVIDLTVWLCCIERIPLDARGEVAIRLDKSHVMGEVVAVCPAAERDQAPRRECPDGGGLPVCIAGINDSIVPETATVENAMPRCQQVTWTDHGRAAESGAVIKLDPGKRGIGGNDGQIEASAVHRQVPVIGERRIISAQGHGRLRSCLDIKDFGDARAGERFRRCATLRDRGPSLGVRGRQGFFRRDDLKGSGLPICGLPIRGCRREHS